MLSFPFIALDRYQIRMIFDLLNHMFGGVRLALDKLGGVSWQRKETLMGKLYVSTVYLSSHYMTFT